MNTTEMRLQKITSWFETYRPLIVILLAVLLSALALMRSGNGFMHSFMGLFFIIFAMFKFLDLDGFAKGFKGYDIVAQRWTPYAYIYPWLELLLGLAYLAHWRLTMINIATLLLMTISAIGVTRSVISGRTVQCACLGTALNVPLSIVSIIENVAMGTMAAVMLIIRIY